jgi:hypothetical protein
MEEILAELLAEMNAMLEQVDSHHGRMIAKMDAFQEKMDNRQEDIKVQVGSLASQIDVNQEEMKAMLNAYLEKMEANPGEKKFVAEQQEVHKEEAAVNSFGALKKWHRGRHLAAECHRKLK